MKKCLFLLSLCLVPFVVFSSTTFTSQNPIELPSDNNTALVLDTNGNPLDPRSSYRIYSYFGDVYLGPSPNSSAPCDNGIFRYNFILTPLGTPVRFSGASPLSRGVLENTDINIQFAIPIAPECVRYTIWKVGDYNVSVGARLLETGGTVGQEGSSWFRIVKYLRHEYNLFYCPGPFACPSCPVDQCQAIGEVVQDFKLRLALANPLRVKFEKAY